MRYSRKVRMRLEKKGNRQDATQEITGWKNALRRNREEIERHS